MDTSHEYHQHNMPSWLYEQQIQLDDDDAHYSISVHVRYVSDKGLMYQQKNQ